MFQRWDLCQLHNDRCTVLNRLEDGFLQVAIQERDRGILFLETLPELDSGLVLKERVGDERTALMKLCRPMLLNRSRTERLKLKPMDKLFLQGSPSSTCVFECLHMVAFDENAENSVMNMMDDEEDLEQYCKVEAAVLEASGKRKMLSFQDLEEKYCIDSRPLPRSSPSLRGMRLIL